MIMNNLHSFIKDDYTLEDLDKLYLFLMEKGTFDFPALDNGLFPAAQFSGTDREYLNYNFVWLRDNIHICHAHYVLGKYNIVRENIYSIVEFYTKYSWRFTNIIDSKMSKSDPNNRPHIRFNGDKLEECNVNWAHDQNDALGAFLWFVCKLIDEKIIVTNKSIECIICLVAKYLIKIEYWKDEDSGHWEENRKICASSIGTVVAGLQILKRIFNNLDTTILNQNEIDIALQKGEYALSEILPNECIQKGKERATDAATLFLIYPYNVLDNKMEETILNNVHNHLEGEYGIRRYNGDSFWCENYKDKFKPEERTKDFSDTIEIRNAELKPGTEAQWCVFDSVISTIYGNKFLKYKSKEFYEKQIFYFNRALKQLTYEDSKFGAYKCPEAYYIENGNWVPNDATPLLWAQANLMVAFEYMKRRIL